MYALDPNKIETLNEITDQSKHDKLVDSMKKNGYNGRPIVVAGGHKGSYFDGITGSHRTIAARAADIDIPAIRFDAEELAAIETGQGETLFDILANSPYDDDDKVKIVKGLLPDHPELQQLHDALVAEADANLDDFTINDN